MNILVTGAAGFIGSSLAYRAYRDKYNLVLLDNLSYGKKRNLVFEDVNLSEKLLLCDIRNFAELENVFADNKFDCVLHFAGIAPLPDCQGDARVAIQVNIEGTVNILELCRKYGVGKMVFASTSAIYENDSIFPSKEKSHSLPTLIYPNTKYSAERFCQSYVDSYGISVTCLRFANVYGPHIDYLRKQPPFMGYMLNEILCDRNPVFYSDGTQKRDYIYIDDLIELSMLVTKSDGFECVNVSSNCSYSVNKLFEIAKKISNKPYLTASFKASNKIWSNYPSLFSGQFPLLADIISHEVNKRTLCDNDYAFKRYGWMPKITIEEGIRKTFNYLADNFER